MSYHWWVTKNVPLNTKTFLYTYSYKFVALRVGFFDLPLRVVEILLFTIDSSEQTCPTNFRSISILVENRSPPLFMNVEGQFSIWWNVFKYLHINIVRKMAMRCRADHRQQWIQKHSISLTFCRNLLTMQIAFLIISAHSYVSYTLHFVHFVFCCIYGSQWSTWLSLVLSARGRYATKHYLCSIYYIQSNTNCTYTAKA